MWILLRDFTIKQLVTFSSEGVETLGSHTFLNIKKGGFIKSFRHLIGGRVFCFSASINFLYDIFRFCFSCNNVFQIPEYTTKTINKIQILNLYTNSSVFHNEAYQFQGRRN